MLGFTTIRTKDYKKIQGEIKGYYQQTEQLNEYFNSIKQYLKGLDMGKIGSFSRDQIKECYETIAPVNGVINYIADNVGEIARYLELRDLKRDKTIENHWILDLLNEPNDRFTTRKFFTAWAINRLLFGDAFVYAPRTAGKDRKITEMYIIPGQRVIIEKGGYDKPMKGIRFAGTDGGIDLDGKVFESFDYNLDDTSFYGTSKIAAAATYLTVMDRAMSRQATSLENGGPANLVTPANGSAPALPSQIDDMEEKMNRSDSANKNIALKTAIEVHQLGDNPANLSILESHTAAINVLCFVYKVPVDIFLGQAKYENAKEAKKTIYEQIAIPMANEFAEDLLHYCGIGKDFELKVNTDEIEVLQDSRTDTLDCIEKMHGSLNELRKANGYDPINENYANQPMIPVGTQFGNEAAFDINETE